MASESTTNNFYMGNEIQTLPFTTNGQHYYSNVLAASQNETTHQQNNNHQASDHLTLIENRNGIANANGCTSNGVNSVDAITSSSSNNGVTAILPQHNITNRWTGGPSPVLLQSPNKFADRYHSQQNGGSYNHYPNSRNSWCFNNIPQGYQRLYVDNCGNFTSSTPQIQSQVIDQNAYVKHNFGFQQRGMCNFE